MSSSPINVNLMLSYVNTRVHHCRSKSPWALNLRSGTDVEKNDMFK